MKLGRWEVQGFEPANNVVLAQAQKLKPNDYTEWANHNTSSSLRSLMGIIKRTKVEIRKKLCYYRWFWGWEIGRFCLKRTWEPCQWMVRAISWGKCIGTLLLSTRLMEIGKPPSSRSALNLWTFFRLIPLFIKSRILRSYLNWIDACNQVCCRAASSPQEWWWQPYSCFHPLPIWRSWSPPLQGKYIVFDPYFDFFLLSIFFCY